MNLRKIFFEIEKNDLRDRWFQIIVGVMLFWGFWLMIVLPDLYVYLTGLVPSDFFYCHPDHSSAPWWACELLGYVPKVLKVIFFVLLLLVAAPLLGYIILSDNSFFISKKPVLRVFLGYHLVLCPFFIFGFCMQKTIMFVCIAIGIFVIVDIIFPEVNKSLIKSSFVTFIVFYGLFFVTDIQYSLGFNPFVDVFFTSWFVGLLIVFGVRFICYRASLKKNRQLYFAIETASKPFHFIVIAIGTFFYYVVSVLGSGTEMD